MAAPKCRTNALHGPGALPFTRAGT